MRGADGNMIQIEWKKEALNAMQIDCPFVVRVVDYFETKTTGFIVMELCEGGTLQEEIIRMGKKGIQFCECVCFPFSYVGWDWRRDWDVGWGW